MHLLLVQFSHAESHLGPREGSPLPRAGVRQPMWKTGGRLEESSCRWFGWSWFIFMDIKKCCEMSQWRSLHSFTYSPHLLILSSVPTIIYSSIYPFFSFFIHSLIHSLICLFIIRSRHAFTFPLIIFFIHSFIYLFIHVFSHPIIYPDIDLY